MIDPEPEDVPYMNRLSIPYWTRCPIRGRSVVSIRYRVIPPAESSMKYRSYPGETRTVYNPEDLLLDTDFICIAEGEIDCMSAVQAGLPCIGIPGANNWQRWHARLVRGYKAVIVFTDDDSSNAGLKFAQSIAGGKDTPRVSNVRSLLMTGGDVNSTLMDIGESGLREMVHSLIRSKDGKQLRDERNYGTYV